MDINWTGKDISINKIVTTSVGTSTNRRNRVLHHLNPPSLNSKITSKGKIGNNTKWSKGTKGCRVKYKQTEATMDYSFFALQSLLFNVSKGFLIYQSTRVMEGRIRAISRHMEGKESGSFDSYEEKSKNIWTCAHILMYMGLRSKVMCTREYRFKSHIQQ